MKLQLRNAIRQLRHERSMSQEKLATLTGVSRQTIISMEAGKRTPSLKVAFRVAGVLGVPISRVFQYGSAE